MKTKNNKGIDRIKISLQITLFSIISSILITFFIMEGFDTGIDLITFSISVIAPALIAPSVTWYIVSLLIKISQLEEEQRIIATFDTLTGLLNRRPFLDKSETILQLAKRKQSSLSIAYIDIDNFKKINDTYGHIGGDAVLESFGILIRKNIRKSDLAARIGGEEFIILLPDTDIKKATIVLGKIRKLIKTKVVKNSNKRINFTVSIGMAEFNDNNQVTLNELISQSDSALYKAKISGKDCIVSYHKEECILSMQS